jgi:cyclic dehypoxanthinyl futalosine synthase
VGLTKQQAIEMLESDDLLGIGMEAHQFRLAKNDPRVVTYQIDRNINYTNFCTEYCSFCAFYRPIGDKEGYILSLETIYQKIEEMLELGGTGVLLQGGLHPDLQVGYTSAAVAEGAIPAGTFALFFGAGNSLHRGCFRA